MTQKTTPCLGESIVLEPENIGEKQVNLDSIMESLKGVGEDVEQIVRLVSEEKLLVVQLTSLLKQIQPITHLVAVSTTAFPAEMGKIIQAHIDSTGYLALTFEDGHQELKDLSEAKNRDLMIIVASNIAPKFENLARESTGKLQQSLELHGPTLVQEIAAPQPPAFKPLLGTNENSTLDLASSPSVEVHSEASVSPPEGHANIEEIMAETLGYLEILGNEKFEHSPVSMYFDDWMVNLRQVILSFESNGVISIDEEFTEECRQIFSEIEDKLAKRLLKEAELEASAKTLAENKHLMEKIDAGYAAQTRALIVKGKSAIDFLIGNVQHLEEELAEIEQIKTSYLHPLKKLAKEQRKTETTEKLNAAKKRLALAVQNSAVEQGKLKTDTGYVAETSDLEAKRKSAINLLIKEVHDLEKELVKIEQTKKSNLNPLKNIAKEQKRFKITEKLNAAKKRLSLAEKDSRAEQRKLSAEYEKKKQATIGKMESIEKEIAVNETDGSLMARQAATKALAIAVKSLIQRKTVPPAQER